MFVLGGAMRTTLLIMLVTIFVITVAHAGGDDILGVWNNQEKDARIEIYLCGEKYCGKIVSLNEPNYPPGSKDGVPGTPKLDHNNPHLDLRKTPILGLKIMYDFAYNGANKWVSGKVYDPKIGKTYSGKMTLVSPNQLNLRGFIGISLIGRTDTWTRVGK
jgi:uncharacterized protein (DUF2147 family)